MTEVAESQWHQEPHRTWTEADADHAAKLWSDGASASYIGSLFGKSRNSVISKMTRMGVKTGYWGIAVVKAREASPLRRPRSCNNGAAVAALRAVQKTTWIPPIRPPEPPQFVCKEMPPTIWLTLVDLTEKSCRWPYGDADFVFCGAPILGKTSYCANHLKRAWQSR